MGYPPILQSSMAPAPADVLGPALGCALPDETPFSCGQEYCMGRSAAFDGRPTGRRRKRVAAAGNFPKKHARPLRLFLLLRAHVRGVVGCRYKTGLIDAKTRIGLCNPPDEPRVGVSAVPGSLLPARVGATQHPNEGRRSPWQSGPSDPDRNPHGPTARHQRRADRRRRLDEQPLRRRPPHGRRQPRRQRHADRRRRRRHHARRRLPDVRRRDRRQGHTDQRPRHRPHVGRCPGDRWRRAQTR